MLLSMSSLFLGGMRRVYEYSDDELNRHRLVIRHAKMCSWMSSLKISMSTLWLGALRLISPDAVNIFNF